MSRRRPRWPLATPCRRMAEAEGVCNLHARRTTLEYTWEEGSAWPQATFGVPEAGKHGCP